MNNIKQFDIGTAALEHLELLNQTNQNPLEIAAQFRILLRSKKENPTNINPNPIDNSTKSQIKNSNDYHYPTINWKQLRQKQYNYKLKQFFSSKFQTKTDNLSSTRSLPSPTTIRTPSISPIHSPQSTYTISKCNSTIANSNEIFFPIADCNIIIKHKPKNETFFL